MSHHNDLLSRLDCRNNCLVPERQNSINCYFQTLISWWIYIYFSFWQQWWVHIPIFWIELRMSLIILVKFWWWNIKTPPPNLHLLLTMLLHCLHLVQPLKSTIVSLIQPPRLNHRNVMTIQLISSVVECLNGSCQDRSVTHVKLKTVLLQDLASLNSLLDTYD